MLDSRDRIRCFSQMLAIGDRRRISFAQGKSYILIPRLSNAAPLSPPKPLLLCGQDPKRFLHNFYLLHHATVFWKILKIYREYTEIFIFGQNQHPKDYQTAAYFRSLEWSHREWAPKRQSGKINSALLFQNKLTFPTRTSTQNTIKQHCIFEALTEPTENEHPKRNQARSTLFSFSQH